MKRYKAWIKELAPIVYDNSKSIYQIVSEIIPILLAIQDNGSSLANKMDDYYNELLKKLNDVSTSLNEFSTSFKNKLLQYETKYYVDKDELIQSIDNITSKYVNDFTNKTNELTKSLEPIRDELMRLVINTLDNYYQELLILLPDYEKSDEFMIAIYDNINKALSETYYDKQESLWIELEDYSTTAGNTSPTSDGLYCYNTSTKTLYKSVNRTWVEDTILPNGLYKYKNQLFYGYLVSYTGKNPYRMLSATTSYVVAGMLNENTILAISGTNTQPYFVKMTSNGSTVQSQNYGVIQLPSGYRTDTVAEYPRNETIQRYWLMGVGFDGTYYYMSWGKTDYRSYGLLRSTDLVNWEETDIITSKQLFKYFNNQLFAINSIGSTLIKDGIATSCNSVVIGAYKDNYYYGLKYSYSNNQGHYYLVRSQSPTFETYEQLSDVDLYYTALNHVYLYACYNLHQR